MSRRKYIYFRTTKYELNDFVKNVLRFTNINVKFAGISCTTLNYFTLFLRNQGRN